MNALSGNLGAILTILAILGVIIGFFRHLISKLVILLLIEVALFILFPNLLVQLAILINAIRHSF